MQSLHRKETGSVWPEVDRKPSPLFGADEVHALVFIASSGDPGSWEGRERRADGSSRSVFVADGSSMADWLAERQRPLGLFAWLWEGAAARVRAHEAA